MQAFQNILVVQSADQPISASLQMAVHLAQLNDCKVKIVDVHHEENDAWWHEIFRETSGETNDSLSSRRDRLNAIVDEADFPDDVKVKVLEGRPISMLVNEVNAGKHDLLLKDAESDSADLFFGSLDMRLIRMSPVPLWISKSTAPPKCRRILAAIDPHVASGGTLMNECIIRIASMLARQEEAELFVVSGWSSKTSPSAEDGGEPQRYEKYKKSVKRRAWENVEHAINQSLLTVSTDSVIFEQGDGASVVASAVVDVQPDLLVMGSVAQIGIPGLLIGNTAEEVTRQIECSLLTLKPDNFSFLLPAQLRA